MARHKQLTWAELRVGIFVLVGLSVLAVGIFYVTGGGVLAPKYRLVTFLPEVEGLATGAPVRIDGVDVGNVDTIRIVQAKPGEVPNRNRNIEVQMRLDRRYEVDIRTDSMASLVTEGLLGNRYVDISRGFTGVPLKEGQEIPGAEEKAVKEVMKRSADLLQNFQELTASVQDVVDDIRNGKGTLGKLVTNDEAYNNLNGLLAKSNQVVGDIQAGHGTVGKLFASDEMYNKVGGTVDNLNAILGDVRAQKGTIGKLLYDPSLYDQAKEALGNGNSMLADIRAGKGTFGKLATDETLYNKLRDTSSNLATATAKLNDNTTTAGKLFSDPQLYDDLTGMMGDLRLLIGDFRKDPKKFLHIKLTIF